MEFLSDGKPGSGLPLSAYLDKRTIKVKGTPQAAPEFLLLLFCDTKHPVLEIHRRGNAAVILASTSSNVGAKQTSSFSLR